VDVSTDFSITGRLAASPRMIQDVSNRLLREFARACSKPAKAPEPDDGPPHGAARAIRRVRPSGRKPMSAAPVLGALLDRLRAVRQSRLAA